MPHYPPLDSTSTTDAEAIVILGGRRNSSSPEYGGDTVGADTLERIRYGAKLARELKLPVAVTGGGSRTSDAPPLGAIMSRVLECEFDQPVSWIETASRNTAQNATGLRALLPAQNIILVTHSLHMKRALDTFEKVGFTVQAAPIDIPTASAERFTFRLQDWLPSASALLMSRQVIYELLGRAYYSLRYR